MKLLKPKPRSAPCELRAMAMVARVGRNGLGQAQRSILCAIQRLVLETDLDLDALDPIGFEDLASQIDDPAQARQVVQETLGRQFYVHCRGAGLPFSGEKGGFPVGALFHDFTHVLAGYDTSPEGEMKAAAFQAGFTRDDDDFFTALFAFVIHTAGINMTPFPMPIVLGRIGQGSLAFDVLHALQRGSEMKVDLGNGWDFWDYVEVPIDLARERLGVPPMAAGVQAA